MSNVNTKSSIAILIIVSMVAFGFLSISDSSDGKVVYDEMTTNFYDVVVSDITSGNASYNLEFSNINVDNATVPKTVINAIEKSGNNLTFNVYNSEKKVLMYSYIINGSEPQILSPSSAVVCFLVDFKATGIETINGKEYLDLKTIKVTMYGSDIQPFMTSIALNTYCLSSGAGIEGGEYKLINSMTEDGLGTYSVDNNGIMTFQISQSQTYELSATGVVNELASSDDQTQRTIISIVVVAALVLGIAVLFRRF